MKFSDWINGIFRKPEKNTGNGGNDIDCVKFACEAKEFSMRSHALNVCVNYTANAIGRCDFRHFKNGEAVKSAETYVWQVSPNKNQNSTAFLHELVARLYLNNEALIVKGTDRVLEGLESLLIADSWEVTESANGENRYNSVTVGDLMYKKTFFEKDVLHLKLNHESARIAVSGLSQSFEKLIATALKVYERSGERKMKVHVDQAESGKPEFADSFKKVVMEKYIKPFYESENSVLPEFDGYTYTDMTEKSGTPQSSRDIKALYSDILEFTAQAFGIPPVLVKGEVEGTQDAVKRFLTNCVDPIADQLAEEINRKWIGFEKWKKDGEIFTIDTSTILHYDLFENASNVEKLIGSGTASINDILRAANLPEIDAPWAKAHYLTKNIASFDEIAKSLG